MTDKKKNIFFKKTSGFTLVELLVVISIIGLLTTIVVVSINNVRVKSRDALRSANISLLASALEIYYNSNSGYPSMATPSDCLTGWVDLESAISTGGNPIITPMPFDPLNTGNYVYLYCSDGGPSDKPQHYVLRALMENASYEALRSDSDQLYANANGGTADCSDSPSLYYCVSR